MAGNIGRRNYKFFKKTCLHTFPYVSIIYGADEPGLLMTFDLMSKNLESLSNHTPLTLFLVGTNRDKYGIIELDHTCFVELDLTKNWLTAPIIKDKTLLT